jgi:hypothetical protein
MDARGEAKTTNFSTFGPWDLSYKWDCTAAKAQGTRIVKPFGVIVFNSDDDSTVEENPEINKTELKGSGSVRYARRGQYYLRATSSCNYRVRVLDRSS